VLLLPSLLSLFGTGCNDTAAVVRVSSDRAPGELDAVCLEFDADAVARFGRRYDLQAHALPQTLTALAGGRSSMQALVYGLRHGVEIARARKQVPFRGGSILQVELALDACVPSPRTPMWMPASFQSADAGDRAALVPSPPLESMVMDAAIAATTARLSRYAASSSGIAAVGGGVPSAPAGPVHQLLAADLDADCRQDLIVLADNTAPLVATRAATGEWVAQPGALPPVLAGGATGAAAGDVDGDGNPDLVLVGGAEAHLLINDGAGRFREAAAAFDVAPTDATAVALGDLDGDGHLDAVIAQGSAAPGLTRVYLNDAKGTGHFTMVAAALPPRAERDSAIALGDVDGNGTLDLVVAHLGAPVRLFLNRGDALLEDRSFGGLPDQVSGDVPTLLLTDLNGDCLPDLVIPRAGAAPLFWANAGGGHFAAGDPFPVAAALGAAADDVNGDGLPDLLFFAAGGLTLLVQQ